MPSVHNIVHDDFEGLRVCDQEHGQSLRILPLQTFSDALQVVQHRWTTAAFFLLSQLPVVQAQSNLGGTGGFNTSTLGALYGIGLAAISIERFPVANLTWTNELWAKFVRMPGIGSRRQRSEVLQLRWFTRGRWSAWDSPYPLFNGLGSHRVVVIGSERPAGATGGAWVCVDESTSRLISVRQPPPPPGRCGGYHYWASDSSWWLAIRLEHFTTNADDRYLTRNGCLEFTKSIPGGTAQQSPAGDLLLKVEHLRYTPTMEHYARMDDPDYIDPAILPKARQFMRVLSDADEAIISTEESDVALATIWSCLAPKQGRGGEKELDSLVHSDAIYEFPEPDFSFRLNLTRFAPSSAIVPHFIETTTTVILPWFGITSLVIIEQVSRKAIWSSLSTGSARYVHSSAYGGELTGQVKNPCSYVTLQGCPSSDWFWIISTARLLLVLGSYTAAIWVQVGLHKHLPTHDDILTIQAAHASGLAAAIVHILTTVSIFACIRRIQPMLAALLATGLITTFAILDWRNVVSPRSIGPVILTAEFISCAVQTTIAAAVYDAGPLEGWLSTSYALLAETRVALILAVPRLAAWFAVGSR